MSGPSKTPAGVAILTCEYPPFPGGIGTYAGRLADAVRADGFTAKVIAPAYPDLPPIADEPDTLRLLRHHGIPLPSVPKIIAALRGLPKDWPVLACDIRTVLMTYALRPLHGRPYRAMIHGSEVSKFKASSPLFQLVRQAYGGADLLASNSQATLDLFSANFGVHPRGVVTYLGVEKTWFGDADGDFEHPALSALPPGQSIVCAVGRIEARKGQLETVQAMARARDLHDLKNGILVIAGRPEDETYAAIVEAEAQKLGVSTIFTGRLSDQDLKRLYRRSTCHSLFARELPGKIEGFGLVLLEAAAQECPSVAAAVGGIPEVLADTGTLTPPDDIDTFAEALASYARDAELRRSAGTAARKRAETFTWARCARETFPELV